MKLPSIINSSINDIHLLYINISNSFYNFFWFIIEAFNFYRNPILRKVDIEFFKTYAIKDQFSIANERLYLSALKINRILK